MDLPATFLQFPDQKAVAERILDLLQQDKRVLGVYLSGSFARGKPDAYSDLDFYILVPSNTRRQIEGEHKTLREKVGQIVSDFPATHLGDPHQFITLYKAAYPIHVDYQYRIKDELTPREKDKDVLILLDRAGELKEWKEKCVKAQDSNSPTQEQLQYLEDRFWVWCIYTDSKIKRGELWEARDAIEYMRNNVVVKLAYYANSLRLEGNRRIETKFPAETISAIESTLQTRHSQKAYAAALRALADCYVQFMDDIKKKFDVQVQERDRPYFLSLLE